VTKSSGRDGGPAKVPVITTRTQARFSTTPQAIDLSALKRAYLESLQATKFEG
jgi:hypothetical protein